VALFSGPIVTVTACISSTKNEKSYTIKNTLRPVGRLGIHTLQFKEHEGRKEGNGSGQGLSNRAEGIEKRRRSRRIHGTSPRVTRRGRRPRPPSPVAPAAFLVARVPHMRRLGAALTTADPVIVGACDC